MEKTLVGLRLEQYIVHNGENAWICRADGRIRFHFLGNGMGGFDLDTIFMIDTTLWGHTTFRFGFCYFP